MILMVEVKTSGRIEQLFVRRIRKCIRAVERVREKTQEMPRFLT